MAGINLIKICQALISVRVPLETLPGKSDNLNNKKNNNNKDKTKNKNNDNENKNDLKSNNSNTSNNDNNKVLVMIVIMLAVTKVITEVMFYSFKFLCFETSILQL